MFKGPQSQNRNLGAEEMAQWVGTFDDPSEDPGSILTSTPGGS